MAFAGQAHAAPGAHPLLTAARPDVPAHRGIGFRLVRDPEFDPSPVYHSGIVGQTEIAPNATLGIGLLKARPKKPGSGEWRFDSGAPRSRKAAVSFLLKF
jgi:hypothetical protein